MNTPAVMAHDYARRVVADARGHSDDTVRLAVQYLAARQAVAEHRDQGFHVASRWMVERGYDVTGAARLADLLRMLVEQERGRV